MNKHRVAQITGGVGAVAGGLRGAFRPTDKRTRLVNMLREAVVGYAGGVGLGYGGALVGNAFKKRNMERMWDRIRDDKAFGEQFDALALEQYNASPELYSSPGDAGYDIRKNYGVLQALPAYAGGGLLGLIGGRYAGRKLIEGPDDELDEPEETKQSELQQAYWNGFAVKCAELGVDAVKLAQAVSEPRLPAAPWANDPSDTAAKNSPGLGDYRGELQRIQRAAKSPDTNVPALAADHAWLQSAYGMPDREAQLEAVTAAGVPTGIRPKAMKDWDLLTPEELLRGGAVEAYNALRENKSPAEAEEEMQSKGGFNNDSIKKLRELISRGIIMAGNRRPGAATTARG